jgi:hypothetical protein
MAYQYTGTNPYITPGTTLNSSTVWASAAPVSNNAIQINNAGNQAILKIDLDGNIETSWGNTSIKETMEIAMAMKALILEMARDEETCKKFPVVEEFAHKWLMAELKK